MKEVGNRSSVIWKILPSARSRLAKLPHPSFDRTLYYWGRKHSNIGQYYCLSTLHLLPTKLISKESVGLDDSLNVKRMSNLWYLQVSQWSLVVLVCLTLLVHLFLTSKPVRPKEDIWIDLWRSFGGFLVTSLDIKFNLPCNPKRIPAPFSICTRCLFWGWSV